ncbi:hypothetical protein PFISCL1PPCAC_10842, partial [Pristionchus fissidentatus]
NLFSFFTEYTTDTISQFVMGQKESQYFNNPRVDVVKDMLMRTFDSPLVHIRYAFPFLIPLIKSYLKNTRTPLTASEKLLREDMSKVINERIETRANSPADPNEDPDCIDIFLNMKVDDHELNIRDESKIKMNKVLIHDEVVAQTFAFILAGSDTTANSLAYTALIIANNHEVMRKCQEEIDEVCREESISYEEINNLRYLEATCKETLRFFPLGTFANSRCCMNTTTVCG